MCDPSQPLRAKTNAARRTVPSPTSSFCEIFAQDSPWARRRAISETSSETLGRPDMFSLGFRVINSHRKGSLPLIAGNVASRRVLPCAGFYHARFLKCLIDEQLHLRTLPQKHMNSSLEVLHQEAACNHRVGTNSHWFLGSIAACLFQRTVSSMRKFDCCFRYVRAPDRCAADGLSPRDS